MGFDMVLSLLAAKKMCHTKQGVVKVNISYYPAAGRKLTGFISDEERQRSDIAAFL
ncbi:hypothetical protein GJU41_20145 [Bacillus idriensis]|uniref:Uncharacterized protein n=1 Tax=Metabacillus idriensis TaxID=324768 RepID=A0A6I2MGV3_9BACI|nr:hypothetical protein [Metabacillus idriensis]MRX56276.1 hypothetical protein [Metabacillus idriensis]